MARPRKATAILEASGAYLRNPQRRLARLNEPQVYGDLGLPPASLNREEQAIWVEMASCLADGVAGKSDRCAFEELVRLKARARRRRLTGTEQGLLLSYLSKFGLTPSDRSKVSAAPAEEQDPLQRFLERKPQ